MKKIQTLSLLWIGALLLVAGCKRNSPEPVVTAKVESSAPAIEVGQTDVPATFTVTLSDKRDLDTEFSVETSGSEGMYGLDQTKLTVKAGSKTGTGTVTFKASAFSAEKNSAKVKITVTTGEKNVIVDKDASSVEITANRKSTPAEAVTASIEAPGTISVGASDRDVAFTVALDGTLAQDAVFTVTASGGDAEAYKLKTGTVTVKAGDESAAGTITFVASKFNSPADNVKVKLTIGTESDKVKISGTKGSAEITAVGQEGDLPTAEITAENTSVEVGEEDVPVVFTVTISEVKSTDAIIEIAASGGNTEKYSLNKTSVTIPKGSTSANGTITFKGGAFEGPEDKTAVTLAISSEDAEISDTKGSVKIEARGELPVVKADISIAPDDASVILGTEDIQISFKISLSLALAQDATVTVTPSGADAKYYTLDNTDIIVSAGKTDATGTVTLKGGTLSGSSESFNLVLTISSDDVEIGSSSSVSINATGEDIPVTARIYFDEPEITIPSVTTTVNYYIELSRAVNMNVVFILDPSSDRTDSHEFMTVSYPTIYPGETLYTGKVTLKGSFFSSEEDVTNVTVKMQIYGTSEVTIPAGSEQAVLVAVGEDAFPGLEKCYFHFTGNPVVTIDAPSSGYKEVSMYFAAENSKTPEKEVSFTYEVTVEGTGEPAVAGTDYSVTDGRVVYPVTTTQNYAYGYINILPGAAEKVLKIKLISDDCTIGTNDTYTVTVNKALAWPPTSRMAPKNPAGYSWNTYSIAVSNLYVNNSPQPIEWQYGQGWFDKYMGSSSDVEIPLQAGAANTLDVEIFSATSGHNGSAFLIVYADYDGDGKFTAAGEEVTVQQLNKDALDGTNAASTIKVPVTITPPAGQTAPFAVRVGVMYVYGVTTLDGFRDVFENGYFTTEPGVNGSYMQVIDYKGVIK